MRRLARLLAGSIVATLVSSPPAQVASAQEVAPQPATIDTIIIERSNVFTEEEAASSGIFRLMNKIHITTHEFVITDYLQFEAGEPFDSATSTATTSRCSTARAPLRPRPRIPPSSS